MAGQLQGQTAVVIGASRGIGRACALALADEGAAVVVAARAEDELNTLAREIKARGCQALVAAGDCSQTEVVNQLADRAISQFGKVDILINNAGVGKFGTLDMLTPEDYDWMMNSNMRTTFLATRAFLPGMIERRSGAVIFVGSVAGLNGLPNETVYCASKHAQYGFARALDHECRDKGVKVSYIAPGGVDTYFAFGTGRTAGDPKHKEYLTSEDVAAACMFAITQPSKGRIFLIGMRPWRETL